MKLVSYNIKIKPETQLNNRSHEILSVILIFFMDLLNCECFCPLKLSQTILFSCLVKLIPFLLFAPMLFGNAPKNNQEVPLLRNQLNESMCGLVNDCNLAFCFSLGTA